MTDVHGQDRSHAISNPGVLKNMKGRIVARIYFPTNKHDLDHNDVSELKKLASAASSLTQGTNATSVFSHQSVCGSQGTTSV